MADEIRIDALGPEETARVLRAIEDKIAERKREGLLTDRDVREIEEMRLRPLPDILDVQSVYANHLFRDKA